MVSDACSMQVTMLLFFTVSGTGIQTVDLTIEKQPFSHRASSSRFNKKQCNTNTFLLLTRTKGQQQDTISDLIFMQE